MGSLPNLHELGRDSDSDSAAACRHTAPATATHAVIDNKIRAPLTSRIAFPKSTPAHHKVFRTRSNGNHNHIHDDHLLLEQMATYSPISARSTRGMAAHNAITQANSMIGRRRESLSSSIGATSVRRLIAVVRNTNSRLSPIYNRRVLVKNILVLCISHVFISASFLPLLALQSSISAWHWPLRHNFIANLDLGSILLSILYLFASFSSLLAPAFVQRVGTNIVFVVGYIVFGIFFAAHLFPIVYVLFPTYVLLGFALGPISISRVTFVMTLSSKMSCVATDDDDMEDHKNNSRRTCLIRRIARALQGAQDIGLIIGSIITAFLISHTMDRPDSFNQSDSVSSINQTLTPAPEVQITSAIPNLTVTNSPNCSNSSNCENSSSTSAVQQYLYYASFDDLFYIDDNGDRICGSSACPITLYFRFNDSDWELVENFINVIPLKTSSILASFYVCCAVISFILVAVGLDRIRLFVYHDPMDRQGFSMLGAVRDTFKDVRLQLAAPLAVFIGLEQGLMYSEFSKSYVMCALGVHNINLVFLSMGLLQSISAFTLSMLLRTIRRYIVIAVGFAFQSCLIMVLILWKPSGDDPALFYVISAAWGVCNSIWEMLNFTLLTGLYSDNWEPAFANSTFFRYLGLALAFGMHGLLCNWVKLYSLALILVLALVPYTFLEVKLENTRKLKNISRL